MAFIQQWSELSNLINKLKSIHWFQKNIYIYCKRQTYWTIISSTETMLTVFVYFKVFLFTDSMPLLKFLFSPISDTGTCTISHQTMYRLLTPDYVVSSPSLQTTSKEHIKGCWCLVAILWTLDAFLHSQKMGSSRVL